ncbi:RING finger protein 11 [Aplysia californica]|uniref:RING finger protein 11 n=1 Tax=Aplysia californica TaxID=6500 RepID=A0ABM0K384_APLCA|nr:RING finger protein 11 [Aplysia californica]
MGNCFKSSSNDDISLLRGNDHHDPALEPAPFVEPPPPYRPQQRMPIFHPSPGVSRPANQLTEDEQIKIAQRLGLINHLPTGKYDGTNKKAKECVICMNEFVFGDELRYLPCMHCYHRECIDDWLMRSFTCPSCMEPVDAALLTTYQTS